MNRTIRFILLTTFLIAFLISFSRHLLGNPNKYYLEYSDWELHLSWAGTARNSIIRYGQVPLWNPFRCGGVPVIGEPESDVFSFYLPIIVVFGPLFGYLSLFIVNLVIGWIGFYKLGRYYGLSPIASLLSGEVYMMSGLYLLPFFVGMTNFISVGYLPYIFLFYEEYLDKGNITHALGAAFFASLMFLSGFHYIPIVLLYMGFSALLRAIQTRTIREIAKCIWVYILFSAFSAVKLFRSIELLLHHGPISYTYEATGGYSLTSLLYSLLSRDQTRSMIHSITTSYSNFWMGANYDIDENGMYIGVLLLTFFFYGYLKTPQKIARLRFIFIIFLIFSFGTNIYLSPYEWIKTLPIISAIRVANRFRYIFMIPVVLMIGIGFDRVVKYIESHVRMTTRQRAVLFSSILLIVGIDLMAVNFNFENISPIKQGLTIIQPNRSNTFYNRCTLEQSEYDLIMQNQGNSLCYDNVLFSTHALCKEDEDYQSRAYFLHQEDTAILTYFSPNVLRIHATTPVSDILLVNQNYNRYWRATIDGKPAPVLNTNHLLSVQLPKGDHIVELRYVVYWVTLGVIISTVTIISCGIYLWKQRQVLKAQILQKK